MGGLLVKQVVDAGSQLDAVAHLPQGRQVEVVDVLEVHAVLVAVIHLAEMAPHRGRGQIPGRGPDHPHPVAHIGGWRSADESPTCRRSPRRDRCPGNLLLLPLVDQREHVADVEVAPGAEVQGIVGHQVIPHHLLDR